jgi:hypothetical protein
MRRSPRVWKFTFIFVLMLQHSVPNWRPIWVVKHGAKNSQMLMDIENTVYKGKICMSIEIIKIIFQKIKMVSTLIAS